MPSALKQLTREQKQTAAFGAGCIVLLALAVWLLFDLSQRRFDASVLLNEVRQKEAQAQSAAPVTELNLAQWRQQERQLAGALIDDQDVPVFFEEITNIGEQNRIQPGITTNEKTIDPASASPEELRLIGLGIRRYMVMTITFRGEYPDAARFLSNVSRLPRAIEIRKVTMRRSPPLVDVTMTMQVYKREGA